MARNNEKKYRLGLRLAIIFIVGIILGVSLLFSSKIENILGIHQTNNTNINAVNPNDVVLKAKRGDLLIHFLDVGQADACIIELPDDKTMIIDGGDRDAKDRILAYIKQNIKSDDGEVIKYFDYAILTHSDADHCGSLDDVLYSYPAKTFYRPNVIANNKGYVDPDISLMTSDAVSKSTIVYKDAIVAAHADTTQKQELGITTQILINDYTLDNIDSDLPTTHEDYYSFRFYGPNNTVYKDWNDYSPIMVLYYGGEKFVLTGDCEKQGESEFVEKVNKKEGKFADFDSSFHANLYKLGHHGSRTSSSEDFLNTITNISKRKNTLLIISCGLNNEYGHPHKEVIDRLLEMGFKSENILRTYESGNIVVLAQTHMVVGGDNTIKTDISYGANKLLPQATKSDIYKNIRWWHIAVGGFIVISVLVLIIPNARSVKKVVNEVDKYNRKNRR